MVCLCCYHSFSKNQVGLILALSKSEVITITDVIENPSLPWDYKFLSMNPNITWKIIISYPEIPWDYEYIARNQMSCPAYCKQFKLIYDIIIKEIKYII